MVRLIYIKSGILLYLLTGIAAGVMLFSYLLTGTYNKNLSALKGSLQKVIIKKGIIREDINLYRKNISQLASFTDGDMAAERAILERIDSLKRLYPQITVKPSGFTKKEETTELVTEINFKSKSYYRTVQLINSLNSEGMPLYQFDSITIRAAPDTAVASIQCQITGRFLFAGKNED